MKRARPMASPPQTIRFHGVSSVFGAASSVVYSDRFAWINVPGNVQPVRVARSKLLSDPGRWGAFYLADIAAQFKR